LYCPESWRKWTRAGLYTPLRCSRKRQPRTRKMQLPWGAAEQAVLQEVLALSDREFEFAAVEIVQLMDQRFTDFTVTPRVRDKGRDAVGLYRVGHDSHQVQLEVVIEAKRWSANRDIGVEPVARLISRIKHRDIGVFVTTSCFNQQVQEE